MAESGGSSVGSKNENPNDDGLLLYHCPSSYYSQKVVFALHEKKLKFRSHFINLVNGDQFAPWFVKLNPKSEVPVLKDGVKIIPDSARIIDYLEDNFSNGDTPRLKPEKGTQQYQTMERFQEKFDKIPIVTLTFGVMSHPELIENIKISLKEKHFREDVHSAHINVLEELAEKHKDLKDFYNGKMTDVREREAAAKNVDGVKKAIAELGSVLTDVEKELATHEGEKEKWWLCGEKFTVADITLALLLARLVNIGLWNHFFGDSKLPKLNSYFKRVQALDSFRKTMNQGSGIIGRICCLGTKEKFAVSLSSAVIVLGIAGLALFLVQRKK